MVKRYVKMVDFQNLHEVEKRTLTDRLKTLPHYFINSFGTGLTAGQLAARIAGLGLAIAGGATGALTTIGSIIVGSVGGIVGLTAITMSILSLIKDHRESREVLNKIIGEDGAANKLKKRIAKLAYNSKSINKQKLGEFLFLLHAIEGENLTAKLCNLYGVAYSRESDKFTGHALVPGRKYAQDLLAEKMRNILGIEDTSTMPPDTFHKAYKEYINGLQNELSVLLSRTEITKQGLRDNINKPQLNQFIKKLHRLPGDNLTEKIACLYGITKFESLTDLQSQINESRTLEDHVSFTNIPALYAVIQKEAEAQYFNVLSLRVKNDPPKDCKTAKSQFKRTLSLIERDNNGSKLNTLPNVVRWNSRSTQFKQREILRFMQQQDVEPDEMQIALKDLNDAEIELNNNEFSTLYNSLDNLLDLFSAFTGSLSGFAAVIGVAAFVGVTIATSGVGLLLFIGAIISAVAGFIIALAVRRYTRDFTNEFNRDTAATNALLDKTLNEAKILTKESQLLAQRELIPQQQIAHQQQPSVRPRLNAEPGQASTEKSPAIPTIAATPASSATASTSGLQMFPRPKRPPPPTQNAPASPNKVPPTEEQQAQQAQQPPHHPASTRKPDDDAKKSSSAPPSPGPQKENSED